MMVDVNSAVNELVEEEIRDAEFDPNHPLTLAVEAFTQRSRTAKRNAAAMRRTAEEWPLVRDNEDWERVVDQAVEDYASGAFLLRQLGGEAALDPLQAATLISLRESIREEWRIETAAECMLLDCAVVAYRNFMRVQNWIENLAYVIEHELFALESPSLHYNYGKRLADGLTVTEHTIRLREGLLPLQDRANRMFVRNLQAIRELRRIPAPTIAVANAAQVNVTSNRQVNVAG